MAINGFGTNKRCANCANYDAGKCKQKALINADVRVNIDGLCRDWKDKEAK